MTPWTSDRIDRLKIGWAAGHSASHIAHNLGGVTRSAVLGKAHRLLLPMRKGRHNDTIRAEKPHKTNGGGTLASIAARQRHRPPPPPKAVPQTLDELNRSIPIGQRVDLMGLTPFTCRWPVGDVGDPGFFFCGGITSSKCPYCAAHDRFNYRRNDECSRTAKPAPKFSPIIGLCEHV